MRMSGRLRTAILPMLAAICLIGSLFTLPAPGLPEVRGRPTRAGHARVVASARYAGGPIRRFLLGGGYRKVWETPVEVEVLDLTPGRGPYTLSRMGGGNQTRTLHLLDASGREFAFRSLDKEQSKATRGLARATVGRVRQDEVSATHPGGALVAAALAEAAGVLHTHPRLMIVRERPGPPLPHGEFAGIVGLLEERPDDGFAGAGEVTGTDGLLEKLRAEPAVRVDGAAFLAARLLDLLLNDWDRHEDQWRWARLGEGAAARWVAVPQDRDYAMADYRGLIPGAARRFDGKIVRFDAGYRDLAGLTVEARALDRRFLCTVPAATWDSVAITVTHHLDDRALAAAIAAMPVEYQRVSGAPLLRTLRARRDGLPAAARRFRGMLHKETCGQR
jgi:hypothetical protein